MTDAATPGPPTMRHHVPLLAAIAAGLLPWACAAAAPDTLWDSFTEAGLEAEGRGANEEALRLFTAAAEQAATLAKDDGRGATTQLNLARAHMALGHRGAAAADYRRALDLLHGRLPYDYPQHQAKLTALRGLARIAHDMGDYAESERLLRRALGLAEYGPAPEETAAILLELSEVFSAQGRGVESGALRRRAESIRRDSRILALVGATTLLVSLSALVACFAALLWRLRRGRKPEGVREKPSPGDAAEV